MEQFELFKKNTLSKKDKSHEGHWDKKIVQLCNRINQSKNYFTTSSCSGRITLVKSSISKIPNTFLFKTHEKISLKQLQQELQKAKNEKIVYFRQDPCALHVACRTFDDALKLLKIARNIGWKKAGIISSKKGFICEMFSTESIITPVIKNKEILVNKKFLKIITEEANQKIQKGWEKIKRLYDKINILSEAS